MENNNLKVFTNANLGDIRVLTVNNEPWFVGRDIATTLGYVKPENALSAHVLEEDKTTTLIQGSGSNYKSKTTIINESGLYSLILSSKLPKAKEFKRWVTSEVLPSLRKNGMYMTESVAEQAISNPTEFLARAVLIANDQIQKLSAENKAMRPKVVYYDNLVEANHLTNLRDTAKELGFKQNDLIGRWLDGKFLYRDKAKNLRPYANHMDLFQVKEWFCNGKTGVQTFVTVKGKEYFRQKFLS